jgi:hypothetical protein
VSAQLSEPTLVDERGSWFDRKTAALYFGVHPNTIRNWADNGDLDTMREPGGRRVLVLIPEAEPATVNGHTDEAATLDDTSALLPVAQEEIRSLLQQALGADEWANRAGVSEEKANHLKQRVRSLREELMAMKEERDAALAKASEQQDRIGDLRVELERAAAERQRVEDSHQRVLNSLSPRQRRRLGIDTP